MDLSEFQSFLYHHMPLTRFMGLRPVRFTEDEVCFWLPLHNNQNDKGTAFGGSTAAAMILAGWSLVDLNLRQRGIKADVVIYRNSCQWLRPLHGDAQVVARFAPNAEAAKKHKWSVRRVRVTCQISIHDKQGRQHSQMQADYMVLPARTRDLSHQRDADDT